jgi:hypothetical protein
MPTTTRTTTFWQCATGQHKMCHNTAQKVLCAAGRHKMCHSSTKKRLSATGRHKMCHNTAQNVLCATGRHKMCHSTALKDENANNKNNKAIIRAGRAALAAKNSENNQINLNIFYHKFQVLHWMRIRLLWRQSHHDRINENLLKSGKSKNKTENHFSPYQRSCINLYTRLKIAMSW